MTSELSIAFLISGALVLALGAVGIPVLKKLKAGQNIRDDGPKNHQSKAGTPTMGGIFILLALTAGTLSVSGYSMNIGILLLLTLGHGLLGFFDDFVKTVKHRNLGLTAKQKLLGQIILSFLFCYIATEGGALPKTLWIPLVNDSIDLGNLYYLLAVIIIVGTSNAVNLTDGLDGLAAGTSAVAAMAYAIIALMENREDIAIFGAAICGATIAFLYFNSNPAKVFMGDTGSLALGGAFAGMAILTKTELLLIVIGGIFVVEALSVILQVASFKLRGVRIFKMSPIHHHFELSGWGEQRVVTVFWMVGIVLAIIGLILMLVSR